MLKGLSVLYFARDPRHRSRLQYRCKLYNDWGASAAIFGDSYFCAALCKLPLPGRFRPESHRLA